MIDLMKLVRIIGIASVSALPSLAFAATFNNPLKANDVFQLIASLISALIKVGAVLIVLFFIFAGFQFVTANGEQAKIKKAKDALLYCVIGGLLLLGAQAIMLLVQSTICKVSPGACK